MPEETPDLPIKPKLNALSNQLDTINLKEQQLTDGMRGLANQADDLMGEMQQLKALLHHYQPEVAETLSPQLVESPGTITEADPISIPMEESIEPVSNPKTMTNIDLTPPLIDDYPTNTLEEPNMAFEDEPRAIPPDPPIEKRHLGSEEEPAPSTEYRPYSAQDDEAFEFSMGIKWLSRLGIVALLIGLTMALCYSFPHFSNEMKLLTGFILALGLFGGGNKLYNQSPVLGRILQGGGLSVGYLSLFAMFFIPEVRLFDANNVGFALLMLYCGGIMTLAHRLKSQTIAILSLGFGYYTSDFAISYWVAFMAAGLLMLSNAGLAKLHPDWKVLAKANLLGALWTYTYWCTHTHLSNAAPALSYLAFTFLIFHTIAVVRNNKGDIVLNVINTLACYTLLRLTHTVFDHSGLPEFFIAFVQLTSLALTYRFRPEQREEGLSYSLLTMGLAFGSMGVAQAFSANTTSSILVTLGLVSGLLARKDIYKPVMAATSALFLVWASAHLLFHWHNMSDAILVWNALCLIVNSYVLDALVYRKYPGLGLLRGLILFLASAIYFDALFGAMPSEWRTISFVLTGFSFLTAGFIARNRHYRITGLAWIFAIGGCSIIGDFIYLPTLYKILLFILLGIGLLGGSYGYVLLEKRLGLKTRTPSPAPVLSEE